LAFASGDQLDRNSHGFFIVEIGGGGQSPLWVECSGSIRSPLKRLCPLKRTSRSAATEPLFHAPYWADVSDAKAFIFDG
jgi:hypothetical protein